MLPNRNKPTVVPVQFEPAALPLAKKPQNAVPLARLLLEGAGIRFRADGSTTFEWKDRPDQAPAMSLRIAQLISREVPGYKPERTGPAGLLRKITPVDFVGYPSNGQWLSGYIAELLAIDLIRRQMRGKRKIHKHIPSFRLRPPGLALPNPTNPNEKLPPTTGWTVGGIQPASLAKARVFIFTASVEGNDRLLSGLAELIASHGMELVGVGTLLMKSVPVSTIPSGIKVPLLHF